VEVLNEQGTKVHPVLHVRVECTADDAHLREVANGRVLDGGGILPQIVQVLVYRNTLPGFLCLLDNFLVIWSPP
jgi:hypothetical protein